MLLRFHSSKLYKDKTIHWLEVVNIRQCTNRFWYGKKTLFRNYILLILWGINFIILRIDILFFDDSVWLKFTLSKFAFRHSWQEQRFSFPIVCPSEKKPRTCNFSQCKILISCFIISTRWSLETTLQSQFGLPRCFCSKCFHLFYIIEKKIICDNTFSERSFYPETAHRISQPFAMSWNTIIQNYSLILLFGYNFAVGKHKTRFIQLSAVIRIEMEN